MRLTGDPRKDQQLLALTLTNGGSARGTDLRSLALYSSANKRLSGVVASLDGDRVRLVMDPPFFLQRSAQYLVEVRADVRASSRRTLALEVDEASDVETRTCTGTRTCVQAH